MIHKDGILYTLIVVEYGLLHHCPSIVRDTSMKKFNLPPHTRYALVAIITLLVASFNVVPDIILGIALLAVGAAQGYDVWLRLQNRAKSSNVTYWRGVRYEVGNSAKRPQWRDIQAEGLWILITLIALVVGLTLFVDALF